MEYWSTMSPCFRGIDIMSYIWQELFFDCFQNYSSIHIQHDFSSLIFPSIFKWHHKLFFKNKPRVILPVQFKRDSKCISWTNRSKFQHQIFTFSIFIFLNTRQEKYKERNSPQTTTAAKKEIWRKNRKDLSFLYTKIFLFLFFS